MGLSNEEFKAIASKLTVDTTILRVESHGRAGNCTRVITVIAAVAKGQRPVPLATSEAIPTDAPAAAGDSSGAAAIESYKLMGDNGSGAAGDEVTTFKPANHVQYFDVQLTQFLKVGSTVNWLFTAVDTSAGKDLKITEVNTKVVVANHLNANLSLEKDFPTGKYTAAISVDGKPVGTGEPGPLWKKIYSAFREYRQTVADKKEA